MGFLREIPSGAKQIHVILLLYVYTHLPLSASFPFFLRCEDARCCCDGWFLLLFVKRWWIYVTCIGKPFLVEPPTNAALDRCVVRETRRMEKFFFSPKDPDRGRIGSVESLNTEIKVYFCCCVSVLTFSFWINPHDAIVTSFSLYLDGISTWVESPMDGWITPNVETSGTFSTKWWFDFETFSLKVSY